MRLECGTSGPAPVGQLPAQEYLRATGPNPALLVAEELMMMKVSIIINLSFIITNNVSKPPNSSLPKRKNREREGIPHKPSASLLRPPSKQTSRRRRRTRGWRRRRSRRTGGSSTRCFTSRRTHLMRKFAGRTASTRKSTTPTSIRTSR